MRTDYRPIVAALLLIVANKVAPAVVEPQFTVRERGAHHNVHQRTIQTLRPDGTSVQRLESYTEMANGLNRLNDQGIYVPSNESIEIFDGFATARGGQHMVIFAANCNTAGAIDYLSADGKRFTSHVLGLAFRDTATGSSVLFAPLKDCIGQVQGSRAIYADAFLTVLASLEYTYSIGSFRQEIVIRSRLPQPNDYGLRNESSRLEVWTEILEAPEPLKTQRVISSKHTAAMDEELDFGVARIGTGRAFSINGMMPGKIGVAKLWTTVQPEGRRFLIESCDYLSIKPHIDVLPEAGQQANVEGKKNKAAVYATRTPPRAPPPKKTKEKMLMAKAAPPRAGFLIDYDVISVNTNSVVFKADATTYISAAVYLTNATFEGGTVLKYAAGAGLNLVNTPTFKTSPFRMVHLTAKDDNTIGATIVGSTGSPSGYYASPALSGHTFASMEFPNLRVSYASLAYQMGTDDQQRFRDCQFLHCAGVIKNDGYSGGPITLENVLIHDTAYAFDAGGNVDWHLEVNGTHVTINNCTNLTNGGDTNSLLTLTNSLLVDVQSYGSYGPWTVVTGYCASASSGSNVFQRVGGGWHYLVSGSQYRNAGTTNISAGVLDCIRKRTTSPPLIMSNAITLDTTWYPQAQRDTDIPDLGYHYFSIDYACSSPAISNATLTLAPGTSVAGYGYGALWIADGGAVVCEGTPDTHNFIGRYNCIQEQSTNWGASPSYLILAYPFGTNMGNARFRFTDFTLPPSSGSLLFAQATLASLCSRDCEFGVGEIDMGAFAGSTYALTNNLFFRCPLYLQTWGQLSFFNNLVYSPYLFVDHGGSVPDCVLMDNAFDGTTIDDGGNTTNAYNAYINTSAQLYGSGGNDLVLANFTYATGPLGFFYQTTTNLVNAGSVTNAGLRGLFHYTTQANQTKEATSRLDVGYHYIATTNGVPIDTDSDGYPDWWEDWDGSGVFDGGETDWKAYNSVNGLSTSGAGLKVYTPLK